MKRIETKRLILRPWSLDDASDLFDYANSDLVGPSAGWKPHQSLEESQGIVQMFIDDNDVWAVELKENGKVIGSIGIHNRKPDESQQDKSQREIGYVLHPVYWGKGYIPEAVESVKDYCFNELNLDLIWCAHFDFNDKSKKVIGKTGFDYCFSKVQKLPLLDNKEVKTLYYCIINNK